MGAPLQVAMQTSDNVWLPPGRVADVRFSWQAPGGCWDAEFTINSSHLVPGIKQGCLVRISDTRTSALLWSGEISSPVRSRIGASENVTISCIGTVGELAKKRLRYAPLVTRLDAWELDAQPGVPYRAGSAEAVGVIPWDKTGKWNAAILTLPSGWLHPNDLVTMRFNGFDDTDMQPAGCVVRHVDGPAAAQQSKFLVYLWNGQTIPYVSWSQGATFSGANNLARLTLNPNADIIIGYQYTGPKVDTNADGAAIITDYLWSGWYTLKIYAQLYTQTGAVQPVDTTQDLLAHQIVQDLVGRGAGGAIATSTGSTVIDTRSTSYIQSLDYDDLVTMADVLSDLLVIEPTFTWMVGPADAVTGRCPLTWAPWPTTETYLLPPGAVIYDEGSSDSGVFNAVRWSWMDEGNNRHTELLTLDPNYYPDITGLNGQCEAEPIDLTNLSSRTIALSVATTYLKMMATNPKSATATLTAPVATVDGVSLQPWELRAGVCAKVPETGDVLPVTAVEVSGDGSAKLTLGWPRKSVADLVTAATAKRRVKKK